MRGNSGRRLEAARLAAAAEPVLAEAEPVPAEPASAKTARVAGGAENSDATVGGAS
jgi:hypothetical protein